MKRHPVFKFATSEKLMICLHIDSLVGINSVEFHNQSWKIRTRIQLVLELWWVFVNVCVKKMQTILVYCIPYCVGNQTHRCVVKIRWTFAGWTTSATCEYSNPSDLDVDDLCDPNKNIVCEWTCVHYDYVCVWKCIDDLKQSQCTHSHTHTQS